MVISTNDLIQFNKRCEGNLSINTKTTSTVPLHDFVLECDRAFLPNQHNAGYGNTIRDVQGNLIAAGCSSCFVASSTQAEGVAILKRLQQAQMLGLWCILILSDSMNCINYVSNVIKVPWYLSSLFRDILFMAEVTAVSYCHIPCSSSGYSHFLACQSLTNSWESPSTIAPPLSIRSVITFLSDA